MSAYFIADITINDPETYAGYLAGFMEIFEHHGGTLRLISPSPVKTIEGDWSPSGLVLLEFPTRAQAIAWNDDPDYKKLAWIRHASAETKMVLVDGV